MSNVTLDIKVGDGLVLVADCSVSVVKFGDWRREVDWHNCDVRLLVYRRASAESKEEPACYFAGCISTKIKVRGSLFTMAQQQPSLIDEETEEPVGLNPKAVSEHERIRKVKHGGQKQEKRAAKRVSGLPKKSGQGGKYTWNGPIPDESFDVAPVALDKKDPNYMDEDEVAEVRKLDTLSPNPQKVIVV